MDNDFLKRGTELCLAVYRVTDRFPESEVLRHRMRAASIDINELFTYNKNSPANSGRVFNYSNLEDRIKILDGYCVVAKKQGWINEKNFEILREEYRKLWLDILESFSGLYRDTEPQKSAVKQVRQKSEKNDVNLSARQKDIVKILSSYPEGATMKDLADKLKISKKTVERDIKQIIESGLAKKIGETRSAKFYAE